MIKTDLFLCLNFCFECFKDSSWQNIVFDIADFFKSEFNINFSRFSFTYLDESIKLKTKCYIFNEKNLLKYKEEFKANYEITALNLFFLRSKDTFYSNPEFCIQATKCNKYEEISDFYIQMDRNIYLNNDFEWRKIFLTIYDIVKESGDIKYGLMNLMESFKFPLFYFHGFPKDGLDEEERKNALNWFDNKGKCGSLIRDVFFANLLTKNHLTGNDSIVEELTKIVGAENLINYNGCTFLYLPFDIKDFNIKNDQIKNAINKIKNVLSKNKMLL